MINEIEPIACPECYTLNSQIVGWNYPHWIVICENCKFEGPEGKSPDKAVELWNDIDSDKIDKAFCGQNWKGVVNV